MLDPWSGVHFGAGLAMGLMGWRFPTVLALTVAYEVLEQAFERTHHGQTFFKTSGPETPLNAVVDVVLALVGWYLGEDWNQSG